MSVRKQRRFSQSATIYVPVSVLLIILLMLFGTSVFLVITEIEVVGASMYTVEEIITSSGISSGDNILFLDTNSASQRVYTDKPFVNDVKITRVPPNAVRIEVIESTALATVEYRDSVLVIDSNCRVLTRLDAALEGLIEIRGLTLTDVAEGSPLKAGQGGEMNLQSMKDVLVAIEKEGMESDISYLDVTSFSKISIGYAGRFRVNLGSPSNARHKLSLLPGYAAQLIESSSADAKWDIDMSDVPGKVISHQTS